jgi:hypothetical protein
MRQAQGVPGQFGHTFSRTAPIPVHAPLRGYDADDNGVKKSRSAHSMRQHQSLLEYKNGRNLKLAIGLCVLAVGT